MPLHWNEIALIIFQTQKVSGSRNQQGQRVDYFASAGPGVRESSLVCVHKMSVHSTDELMPLFTAPAPQGQGHLPVVVSITMMGSPLAPHMSPSR